MENQRLSCMVFSEKNLLKIGYFFIFYGSNSQVGLFLYPVINFASSAAFRFLYCMSEDARIKPKTVV